MEERVYQGHIYRRAAADAPWQLVGPAPGAPPRQGAVVSDPAAARKEARADQDQGFEAERVRLAREAEDRQRAKDELDRRIKMLGEPPKGMRPNAALTGFEPIPGYTPEKKEGDGTPAEMGRINALVRQINEVQNLFDKGPGKTAGVSGIWDFLPSGENSAFDKAANALEDVAVGAFKVPGMGAQSDADAARLAAAVKPDRWGLDAGNRQLLNDLRGRVDEWYKARGLAVPKWEGLVAPLPNVKFGDQPDVGAALAGAGQAKINPDGSVEVLESDGTRSLFPSTEDYQRGMAERRLAERYGKGSQAYANAYEQQFGSPPPLEVDVHGGAPRPNERDSFLGGIDASIRGVADTATLGLADPLAAGVSSLFNGKGFTDNWAAQRQLNKVDERVNPNYRFAGQLAGAIPTGIGLARGGAALMPGRPLAGTALAETAGGGLYGGVTNPDDPVAGALVGGSMAFAGNQVGQRVLAPAIDRVAARIAGEGDPVVRALASASEEAGLEGAGALVEEAQRLNVPMALADADPRLRALAGSATRMSPNARGYAEDVLAPRGRAQAERASAAIERDFGPAANMIEARQGFRQQAQADSRPFYEAAFARAAPVDDEIATMLATPGGQEALNSAVNIARNEGRDPLGMGFDLDELGNVVTVREPTFETLHMVKRGLDSVVEGNRGVTGVLNREDPAVAALDNLRARFRGRLGELDENYAAGNAAYAAQMRNRDALDFGYDATRPGVNPNTLADAATRMPLPAMQQGYRTGLAEQVDRMRYSGNPFDAVYGTPDQVAKIEMLFPEGAANFGRQTEIERLLGRTQYETLGGSPTAGRAAADAQLAPGMGMQMAGESLLGMATGVPPIGALTSAARATLGDRVRMGFGGAERADAIAHLLLNPDAEIAAEILARIRQRQAIQQQSRALGAVAGSTAALPFIGGE